MDDSIVEWEPMKLFPKDFYLYSSASINQNIKGKFSIIESINDEIVRYVVKT